MKKTIDYKTEGTCSKMIHVTIEDNRIESVTFDGGCMGNLQGISALVKGRTCEDVISAVEGIKCGRRGTSCPDQLSKALRMIGQE